MKLIERTSQRLTLKSRPWIAWLGGSFCAGIGLMLLAIPKPSTHLTCARTQGTCQLLSSGLGYSSQKHVVAIEDLHKAQMELPPDLQQARRITKTTAAAYAVILHTHKESLVIGQPSKLGQSEPEQMVRQINDFIQNPQTGTLSIDRKADHGIHFLGAFCIVLGGLIAVAGRSTQVSFDRSSGLVKIVWHSLLKDRTYDCQLQNIAEVRLERSVKRLSSFQPIEKDDYGLPNQLARGDYFVYRIILTLTDGSQLPLTEKFVPDLHWGEDTAELAGGIKQFLKGIPLLSEAHGVRMDKINQNL
jgi:hypothetical protein